MFRPRQLLDGVPPRPTGVGVLRLLLVLCVTVPLLLLAAFSAYRLRQMEAEAELRLNRSLAIAHEHALRTLAINQTLLQHVRDIAPRAGPVGEQQRARLHLQLAELAGDQPQVHALWVQGADGSLIASSLPAPFPAPAVHAAGERARAHRDGYMGLHLSPPQPYSSDGRVFDMSMGRYDDTGAFAGVVALSMQPSYFARFHQTLAAEEPGVAVTVFREDGVVYSRWPPLPTAPERMSPQGEVLSRVLAGETEGFVRNVSSLDQRKRLIIFRKLGDYPVYIGVGRELGAVRAELRKEVAQLAAFGAVPVLGVLLTAWLAMRRTRESLVAADRLRQESEARREAEEALFQAQKMEALGRLTGGVAHDFNNALMVISGHAHMLRRKGPEALQRHLDAIGRAVESSTHLTRQLLAFSRRQALSPTTLRLQDSLPAMRDLIAPTLGSRIALSIEVDPATAPIHLDGAELELALINLAVNARDAMGGVGHFTLRAGPVEAPDGGSAAWVLLEAQDSGPGMPPEVAARAFEPFFTTKPAGKGTGLGLSQVYGLCQHAGGQVDILSAPGQGTTVRMRFPPTTQPQLPAATPVDQLPTVCRTVLLVEDNLEVAQVVQPTLEALGCTVTHASTAALALAALARGDAFDVLLSDVVMPGGMDGVALAMAVRERYPQVAVLLMTGYSEQIRAIADMGLPVLPKPFTPEALAQALARLDGAQGAGDSPPSSM
ncbi:hybrid sensor histidine kinase/response regulator [Ramlibacter rhizophilus]|uniref:histidine kinase n=1 Tax=Ramlibacter rhizophilus TaxID=1781167 RepID=A0A4Z0BGQ8_9BURK|nr:ATP-binding protein [Ramlibacter rhizophilus]TFY97447.1 response regulator [Ramlibacter rhizophilus]